MKKSKNKTVIQRNPVAEVAWFKTGAGVHEKTYKMKRATQKVELKKVRYDE